MTDADVATRTPESDAAEDAPKLCNECVADRPTPDGRTPTGETRKLGDVDVYVAKPSEYPRAPARLLLLLTGGTGMRSTNNQIQADMYAAAGFVVVMPDLFDGDVAPNTSLHEDAEAGVPSATAPIETPAHSSFLDIFKFKAVETVKSFMIDMWLARHTEAKVMPILRRVLDASRDEFADAVSSGDGVYAAGYCFGARYVLLLAADGAGTGTGADQTTTAAEAAAPSPDDLEAGTVPRPGPLVKAGALAHATLVSPADFAGLQAPISMVCVENDPMFPDEVRVAGEDYLSKHSVEHEVQVYPGVPHGFAVVGDYPDENIKMAQQTAFEQMLKWLQAH